MVWSLELFTFLYNRPWKFQPTKGINRLSTAEPFFLQMWRVARDVAWSKLLWAAVGNRNSKWWLRFGSPVFKMCSPFTSVEWHIKHFTLALPQSGAHGSRKLDYGLWQLGDYYWSQANACWHLRVGSPECVLLWYRKKINKHFWKILTPEIWSLRISLFLGKVD